VAAVAAVLARVGPQFHAGIVGAVVLAAAVANLVVSPHPTWFAIAGIVGIWSEPLPQASSCPAGRCFGNRTELWENAMTIRTASCAIPNTGCPSSVRTLCRQTPPPPDDARRMKTPAAGRNTVSASGPGWVSRNLSSQNKFYSLTGPMHHLSGKRARLVSTAQVPVFAIGG
jgi:hypothetical protein